MFFPLPLASTWPLLAASAFPVRQAECRLDLPDLAFALVI